MPPVTWRSNGLGGLRVAVSVGLPVAVDAGLPVVVNAGLPVVVNVGLRVVVTGATRLCQRAPQAGRNKAYNRT